MSNATVIREVVLPGSAERVWETLTDPTQREEWLGSPSEFELEPGAPARFDGYEGVIEEVDEPRVLSWRWWPEGAEPDDGSSVRIEVEPDGDEASTVRVTETAALASVTAIGARRTHAPVGAGDPSLRLAA